MTETESVILEQLAEITKRLDSIESKLAGVPTPGPQPPAPVGSFAYRLQKVMDESARREGKP